MKRRRVAKGIWTFLLVLSVVFLSGDTFGAGSPILQIARPHLFSVAGWEIGNFPRKWVHTFQELFPGSSSQEEDVQEVRRYFELTKMINREKDGLRRVLAGLDGEADRVTLENRVKELESRRNKLESSVERTMEGMISRVLKDEGISSTFLFVGLLWPPVDLRLAEVPRLLIVSPRDRIELQETHLLDPDINADEIVALEETIDLRDLSSLVSGIAGVATYPSLVPDDRSLRSVLTTAAHEWVHHYLFFHPLGRSYWASGDMTTVNETVADIVGQEIGLEVYRRFFAQPEEENLAEPGPDPPPADSEGPEFDFDLEMRETRLMADRLLGQGLSEEAEAYMEQRRLFMAENGFVFRKLNQAFFAFNGTYAERPGSVSPIGEQMRGLRESSDSLSDFLFTIAGYASYGSILRDLGLGS